MIINAGAARAAIHGSRPRDDDDGEMAGAWATALSNAPSIARRRSWMSLTRCLGSFCRLRFRNARSVGETSRGMTLQSGSARTTAASVSVRLSPGNARLLRRLPDPRSPLHRLCDLLRDGQRLVEWHSCLPRRSAWGAEAGDALRKILAFDEFHDEGTGPAKAGPYIGAHVASGFSRTSFEAVDLRDVRMVQ